MSRRVVFACFGAPGWGDANGWVYRLFARLGDAPFEVAFVELLTETDAAFFRLLHGGDFDNPLGLDGLRRCPVEEPKAAAQPALDELLSALAPDLLVAAGISAARVLRTAAPDTPLVLMISGCVALDHLIEEGYARDWVGFRAASARGVSFPLEGMDHEREVLRASDLIVPASRLLGSALQCLYPKEAGKLYASPVSAAELASAEAERCAPLRRPFAERDVDVLFAAADWRARARNLRLAARLSAALAGLNVHLAGETDRAIGAARVHGALRPRDLSALLGRTKVVVSPALFDGGPSVLLDAAAMGCNVVASPNCGHAEACDDELIAPRCRKRVFVDRIRRAVAGPLAVRRDALPGGCADLVETLAVF